MHVQNDMYIDEHMLHGHILPIQYFIHDSFLSHNFFLYQILKCSIFFQFACNVNLDVQIKKQK